LDHSNTSTCNTRIQEQTWTPSGRRVKGNAASEKVTSDSIDGYTQWNSSSRADGSDKRRLN
jgi:hypothetical protein